MESVSNVISRTQTVTKSHVNVNELSQLANQLGSEIQILSLDCFDTLLWRQVATPADAFYAMQERPAFKNSGLTARLRAQAEEKARHKMLFEHGKTEVTLRDIYLAHYTHLSNDELDALAAEELTVEKEVCYALPAMVALIREVMSKNIKVIIVSDTYFTQAQLRSLLQHCLPSDVYQAIHAVYCSNEFGFSKSSGLFNFVLNALERNPQKIFHLGDNISADFVAPQAVGIQSMHLTHYHNKIGEMLRMRALAGGVLDPMIRQTRPLVNPFRGVFASANIDASKPESIVGYFSVGPIMYAFSQFIINSIEELKSQRKNPKVVFLMRDGYLPSLACEAFSGNEIGKRVRISRFASYAASFRSKEDVDRYLSEMVTSLRFYDICKQLLIPSAAAEELIDQASKSKKPIYEFIKLIHQNHILHGIFKASAEYRKRLFKHLQDEVNLKSGDTLVFVDLGYTGTSQLRLQSLFKEEMNVEIVGRYLIALRTPRWEQTRAGLLDPSWCDDRTMQTIVNYIALLEQICTSNEKSVIDYSENGEPIYSSTSMTKAQHGKLDLIQAEVLQFIRDVRQFVARNNMNMSESTLRDMAMAELTRLLYFPTDIELDFLKSFEFDVNMGANDVLNVFDQEKGLTGLRRRGLFFMEKNLKTMRTNYPAELRSAGIELVLTLMQQHRYGFDIRVNDLSLRREPLNVIAIRAGNATQTIVEATPTFDGYFSLIVPVGSGDFQVGIQFGLRYQWLQVESVELIVTTALYGSKESEHTQDATPNVIVDQMAEQSNGLYECQSETSLLVYVPNGRLGNHNYALRVVYRPILTRKK